MKFFVNPSGATAETGILVNSMAVHALASCAALLLTIQDKCFFVFSRQDFSSAISVLRNGKKHKYIFMLHKLNLAYQGVRPTKDSWIVELSWIATMHRYRWLGVRLQ